MSSSTVSYNSALNHQYTGTLAQPDTVSVFFKSTNDVKIFDENLINSIHYSPRGYFENLFLTASRIETAAKKIFQGNTEELGNALKNLSRAIVQCIPLLGSGLLYVYDKAKSHFYIHPQIKAALAGNNEPVLGFAFDGKIVCTFSRDAFERHLSSFSSSTSGPLHDPHAVLTYMWLKLLERSMANSTRTRHDLALSLAGGIQQRV